MKISKAIKEVLRRSDLVEEYNFRSISEESFLAVCIVFRIPTLDLLRTTSQSIMAHARKLNGFSSLQPSLETCIDNNRYLDELSRKWNTSRVKRLDDTELNEITFCGLFCDRTEKVLQELLGKLGIIGSECEAFLFAAA